MSGSSSSEEEKVVETKKKAPAPKKKPNPKMEDTDSDSEVEEKKVEVKKSAFALLMDDDDSSESNDSESDDEPAKPIATKKAAPVKAKPEPADPPKGGKKGKKKKRKDDSDEEDLDKMLEELKLEYEGKKPEKAGGVNDAKGTSKKDSKKKAEAEIEDDDDENDDDDEGGDEGGTVKTAAQKRKEKKERQKQKLAAQKANQAQQKAKAKKPEGEVKAAEVESKKPTLEAKKSNDSAKGAEAQPKVDDNSEAEPEDEGDKKKKKKGEKEDPKKKGKKPGKGTLAAMQEALKKVQEEEERLRREEEEKIRLEEEAERERLEKKKLEQEKKEAKKQREREKREQLRKEGKLLTAKQKAEKARVEATLEAMREHGFEVPKIGEKKTARPGTRIRVKKEKTPTHEPSKETTPDSEVKLEVPPKNDGDAEVENKEEPVEEVADSWEDKAEALDNWEEALLEDDGLAEKKKKDEKDPSPTSSSKKDDASDEENEDDSESDDDEDDSEEEEEDQNEAEKRRERAMNRIMKRREENEKNRSVDVLRAPVVCVLGHVDTGKTKILDKLRRTHVQDGEAGGITQQIGATNVPIEVIKEQCKMVKNLNNNLKLPGLLIIDTPGHESFSNLRDRGSSLCDIAILVVDIMHNLEPQTIESINLLKKKKTPFVIALNKIDRLYEWKPNRHKDVQEVIDNQQQNTKLEFQKRAQEVIIAIAEQGLNAALFYENPDPKTYISMVPTSAHSGDGMGNLMGLLVQLSQTMLAKRLAFSEELQATVLEVKAIPGLGTTIDIVLVNGSLKEGQTMILAGTDGPIVTPIKALLTPAKMQDLRVKNTYIEHKEIRAAQGVKISAKELEKAIAGLNLLVAYHPDEIDICRQEMAKRLQSALNSIKLSERGVFVQASTLGSLEALLEFLRSSKIPYAGVKIGPVVKRDVMKASVMLEHEEKYTVILAFDVKIERDAQEMADSMKVKIFQADIIYHLFDRFTEYQEELKRQKREEFKHLAVFPCKIRVLPNFVFNSRDPIVCGVVIEAGVVRQGTPLCVPTKEFLDIGLVTGIESNHKEVETARKGEEVCLKIDSIPGESPKMFGRHFDATDFLVSKISRQSIDVCKQYFRDDLVKTDWQLMVELKKTFEIM